MSLSSSSTPSSEKDSQKVRVNRNGMISLASKRRYIAPQQQLENYGAKGVLRKPTSSPSSSSSSAAEAMHPSVEDVSCSELVGISICGWDVTTSQGPIGDHLWFESTTDTLEQSAQYDSNKIENIDANGRKIVLPEMVFPHAHVFVGRYSQQSSDGSSNNDDKSDVGGCMTERDEGTFITWDAVHALREWSEAHQQIPLPSHQKKKGRQKLQQQQQDDIDDAGGGGDTMSSLSSSFRGVSVLESSDAYLWKRKLRSGSTDSPTPPRSSSTPSSSFLPSAAADSVAIAAIENTTFHYDWTYSTPFVGSIATGGSISTRSNDSGRSDQIAKDGPRSFGWCSLERSGMDMSLLTDQSVPILYYDQVDLYEDDLHDNGFISYGVKVRVMPRCIYVLARLFLRVDNVLVRVRDARWLVDFQEQCIFRDVTWREAYWDRLGQLQLPTQVKSWTAPAERQTQQNHHQSSSSATAGGGGGSGSGGRELHAFQSLLNKLPVVEPKDMPSDLPLHAVWNYKV